MDLLLIRHAIAEDPHPDLLDAERAVTRRGRKRFRGVVQGLAELGLRLDLALHSPLVRARQTADFLTPILDGPRTEIELLARPPSEALLALLSRHADLRVALVGHEPWMGELTAWLVTGRVAVGENLPFRKGGVAWLTGDPAPGAMVVRAFLPPSVLRAVAGAR